MHRSSISFKIFLSPEILANGHRKRNWFCIKRLSFEWQPGKEGKCESLSSEYAFNSLFVCNSKTSSATTKLHKYSSQLVRTKDTSPFATEQHNRTRYDQLDCHSASVLQLNPNRTESVKKFTSKVVKQRRQRHQSEYTLHFTLIRLHRLSVADSAQCEARHERDENLSFLFICCSVLCSPTADKAAAHKRERNRLT